jgi:hypothetical protein
MHVTSRATAAALILTLAACAQADPTGPAAPSFAEFGLEAPSLRAASGPTILTVPTYDGSGQAVHPDVLWFPQGWRGWEYWMAFTPYPRGKQQYENPSIVVSHDGKSWVVPQGLINPIVRPGLGGAYNSDPDLSYDVANDRLVMLSRQVSGNFNVISSLTSANGTAWSAPKVVFRRRNHGMISPALILPESGRPQVYYVDAGGKACPKRSTRILRQDAASLEALRPSAVERGWGAAIETGLQQPGYWIWHVDVTWVSARQEYWALYPAYPKSGCGARDLFFARSQDGKKWTTYPSPLLRHLDQPWTRAMLYRASAVYDADRDVLRVFLSASAPGPDWRLGYAEFALGDVLAAVSAPAAAGALRAKSAGPELEPLPESLLP